MQVERQFRKTNDQLIVIAVAPNGRPQLAAVYPGLLAETVANILTDTLSVDRSQEAFSRKIRSISTDEFRDAVKKGLG